MASGRPVIIAAKGEAADLVRRSGGGIVVEPHNPGLLAEAVSTFLSGGHRYSEDRGADAYRFYQTHLSESVGAHALKKIITRLK